MNRRILFVLVAFVFFVACKKDPGSPDPGTGPGNPPPPGSVPPGQGINEPGYGPSTAAFRHPAWNPGNGVTVDGQLHNFEVCIGDTGWLKKHNRIGIPNSNMPMFLLCLNLKNNDPQGREIEIRLPPAIVIRSTRESTQNGIIITNSAVIRVPKQGKRIYCYTWCLNYQRRGPAGVTHPDEGYLYAWDMGPSTIPDQLTEIVNILEPRQFTWDKVLKPDGITEDYTKSSKLMIIQEAIWDVTDRNGLTEARRKALRDITL